MVKSCGYRVLRLIVVCVVVALILLVVVSSWRPTTQDVNTWVGVAFETDGPAADREYFPLLPGGDNGRLELPVAEILMPDLVPPDVHFIWCGERWFEFKHYLSVMSVRRAIQPDKIYIHYEQTPPLDRVYYHQVWHCRTTTYSRLHLRLCAIVLDMIILTTAKALKPNSITLSGWKLVGDRLRTSFVPASNLLRTSFEPASNQLRTS